MNILEVDKKIWQVAKKVGCLFDGEKYCIVGLYLKNLGVSDKTLHNVECIDDLEWEEIPQEAQEWLVYKENNAVYSEPITDSIFYWNDNKECSEEIREMMLKDLFKTRNIDLVFKG